MHPGGDNQPLAPEAPTWFEQMLGGMGFPSPQQLVQELQRLNGNLEQFGPSISSLVTAMEKLNPADIQNLTSALQEASRTGQSLINKLK